MSKRKTRKKPKKVDDEDFGKLNKLIEKEKEKIEKSKTRLNEYTNTLQHLRRLKKIESDSKAQIEKLKKEIKSKVKIGKKRKRKNKNKSASVSGERKVKKRKVAKRGKKGT